MPFAVTGTGEFLSDGAKICSPSVVPDAGKRDFFYGVNFELGYEMPQFAPTPWALEILPIIGVRNKEWEFIVNPIVDIRFGRAARQIFYRGAASSQSRRGSIYRSLILFRLRQVGNILPLPQQSQQLYAVTDFKVKDVDVELALATASRRDRTASFLRRSSATPFRCRAKIMMLAPHQAP